MTLPHDRFNLAAHVLGQADARGDHPALEVLGDGGEVLSYAALDAAVRGTATGLLQQGLTAGDRVLLRLGNTSDFPIAYLAAILVDLVPIPTSAALTSAEVDGIVSTANPRLVLQADGISAPTADLPSLTGQQLRAMRDLPPADAVFGDADRPAYIILTSGTGGQARAVVHAHRAILARQMMWTDWYDLRSSDRLMHAGAFNWTYTLGTGLLDPWAIGATALIPATGTRAEDLPQLMARHGATIFAAAPAIYRRLLRADIPTLPALRHGLSAGEKLPESLRLAWRDATGTEIHEAYGMSECSTFISGAPSRPAPPETLGFPQTGRRVQLMPDGMIAVHRSDPGLMLGYLDAPDATAAKFDGDWFLTGDLGEVTATGAIRYAGRADDMMNAGGVRVSPIEVETALSHHPAITDVACAELRLRDNLSLIGAFYVAERDVAEDDLRDFAAQSLAAYKVPRLFIARTALPRGANNKILRRVLRSEWETANGQA